MAFQGKVVELEGVKMLKRPIWQERVMREGKALFHTPTHDPKSAGVLSLSSKN